MIKKFGVHVKRLMSIHTFLRRAPPIAETPEKKCMILGDSVTLAYVTYAFSQSFKTRATAHPARFFILLLSERRTFQQSVGEEEALLLVNHGFPLLVLVLVFLGPAFFLSYLRPEGLL